MSNEKLHILNHPLLQHKVTLLRDKNTGSKEFRELVSEVAMLMTYEATRDLPLKAVKVQTPIAIANSNVISGRKIAFIPVLRAGLGMVEGAVALVPAAKVGHIGICRDENASLVGLIFAQKERKKGGLSAPVRSDDAKAVVRLERK